MPPFHSLIYSLQNLTQQLPTSFHLLPTSSHPCHTHITRPTHRFPFPLHSTPRPRLLHHVPTSPSQCIHNPINLNSLLLLLPHICSVIASCLVGWLGGQSCLLVILAYHSGHLV
ncbi:unnamed protein product [Heterobilharzia americana]|nr:unnamed protein product [Heterobilharzia americana]